MYYFCTYNGHIYWDSLQVECQSPINNTLGVIECTEALGVVFEYKCFVFGCLDFLVAHGATDSQKCEARRRIFLKATSLYIFDMCCDLHSLCRGDVITV